MTPDVQDLQRQLQQLQALHANGSLGDALYNEQRALLERQLIDAVVNAPAPAPAPATQQTATAAALPRSRMLTSQQAVLGLLALLVAAGGYWWTGSPGRIGQTPTGFGGEADAAQHALSPAQIDAMTEKLAERLRARPDDAEGWSMLGRAYGLLNRNDEALAAFERVIKLRPDDASSLADYADALALKNGRTLEGEPLKLINRALQLDPDNLKALLLAGSAAFNRGEFALAAQRWDRAGKIGPADNMLAQQARSGAAEARERGKLPAAAVGDAGGEAVVTAAVAETTPAATGGTITGIVSLAPSLLAKASPQDTVFVFARAATGSRMPLAILRKQVKDLPLSFQLDDSLAMSPAARLSGAGQVVVGARISKSGQAMPQPGDLEGLSAPMAVGAVAVKLLISAEVK